MRDFSIFKSKSDIIFHGGSDKLIIRILENNTDFTSNLLIVTLFELESINYDLTASKRK